MRVIFLDVDGVLNSAKDGFSNKLETSSHLSLLQEIVEKTDSKIVLTSSWRKIPFLLRVLEDKLCALGIKIIGSTASLPGTRGSEIKEWLGRNKVESFVILDDDSDMDEMTETNWFIPIIKSVCKEEADKAVQILLK